MSNISIVNGLINIATSLDIARQVLDPHGKEGRVRRVREGSDSTLGQEDPKGGQATLLAEKKFFAWSVGKQHQ